MVYHPSRVVSDLPRSGVLCRVCVSDTRGPLMWWAATAAHSCLCRDVSNGGEWVSLHYRPGRETERLGEGLALGGTLVAADRNDGGHTNATGDIPESRQPDPPRLTGRPESCPSQPASQPCVGAPPPHLPAPPRPLPAPSRPRPKPGAGPVTVNFTAASLLLAAGPRAALALRGCKLSGG